MSLPYTHYYLKCLWWKQFPPQRILPSCPSKGPDTHHHQLHLLPNHICYFGDCFKYVWPAFFLLSISDGWESSIRFYDNNGHSLCIVMFGNPRVRHILWIKLSQFCEGSLLQPILSFLLTLLSPNSIISKKPSKRNSKLFVILGAVYMGQEDNQQPSAIGRY